MWGVNRRQDQTTRADAQKDRTMHTAKPATLTALRTAQQRAWQANDTAETLKHIADGHQDLDAIMRYSTELTLRLEAALQAARTLEGIARNDIEQKRAAEKQHAALLQEIA